MEKPKPTLIETTDAIVRVTMSSICTSDLHIKHGSVPRAVPGITVGHEMVGVVEEVGAEVTHVKPGDRVAVNVETFCGECFFCRNGYVNNCTDANGDCACDICGQELNHVYDQNLQGTTGTFGELTIDATAGKLAVRDSDSQFNQNTKISFAVKAGATVTITSYPGYHNYTVNGVEADADAYTISFDADGTVEIVATATSYLFSIIITY